jgi:hypothetical protein
MLENSGNDTGLGKRINRTRLSTAALALMHIDTEHNCLRRAIQLRRQALLVEYKSVLARKCDSGAMRSH